MRRVILTALVFCGFGLGAQAQTCDCPESYAYVVQKLETNYAGFQDKVTLENQAAYQRLKARTKRKARRAKTTEACAALIKDWLTFFRDGHVYLSAQGAPSATPAVPLDTKKPSIQRLDAHSTLLVLPSFRLKYTQAIDSLVSVYAADPTPQLIIDIRGNGGGGDRPYFKLLPLLYTRPFEVHGVEFLATKDNSASFEQLLKQELPADTRKVVEDLVAKMKANQGQFVLYGQEKSSRTYEPVPYAPNRVAVIQDSSCASAAEQFLLYALQSDKTTTYGASNSKGALDYANLNELPLPGIPYVLNVPTSRSTRLPEVSVDKAGIAPQVKLPADAKDVVRYVQEQLSRRQ
ncbi:MAG: hypothetical protein LPK14_03230 [Hymenobacteraceae bacterium]|nr:hypothetical protein [Hymenobacteraceae bacterium]